LSDQGKEVAIVDKTSTRAFGDRVSVADVPSSDALRNAVPEGAVLVNLAVEHRDDVRPKRLYNEVNMGGAKNLCRIALGKNINKIIFSSTVAIYG